MIESWGPVTIDLNDTSRKMGMALRERTALRARKASSPQTFSSLDEAARKVHAALTSESPVYMASVKTLVTRSLTPMGDAGRLGWRYDNKLKPRGLLAPSEEQVLVVVAEVKCPVLVIEGEKGFLKARYGGPKKVKELQARKEAFKSLELRVLPGAGHYPHMDHPSMVADFISPFVTRVCVPK